MGASILPYIPHLPQSLLVIWMVPMYFLARDRLRRQPWLRGLAEHLDAVMDRVPAVGSALERLLAVHFLRGARSALPLAGEARMPAPPAGAGPNFPGLWAAHVDRVCRAQVCLLLEREGLLQDASVPEEVVAEMAVRTHLAAPGPFALAPGVPPLGWPPAAGIGPPLQAALAAAMRAHFERQIHAAAAAGRARGHSRLGGFTCVPFDRGNPAHGALLSECLWPALFRAGCSGPGGPADLGPGGPGAAPVPAIDPHSDPLWAEVAGFQGPAPWSDLRSVGITGPLHLAAFARAFPSLAGYMMHLSVGGAPLEAGGPPSVPSPLAGRLSRAAAAAAAAGPGADPGPPEPASDSIQWFPFAAFGVNVSRMVLDLLFQLGPQVPRLRPAAGGPGAPSVTVAFAGATEAELAAGRSVSLDTGPDRALAALDGLHAPADEPGLAATTQALCRDLAEQMRRARAHARAPPGAGSGPGTDTPTDLVLGHLLLGPAPRPSGQPDALPHADCLALTVYCLLMLGFAVEWAADAARGRATVLTCSAILRRAATRVTLLLAAGTHPLFEAAYHRVAATAPAALAGVDFSAL
ncbi:hypothetical protein H696_01373 [Fonticula alba]|uniref:ELMO domain-containing protein n=1 Tax=Fonticula alba TaxID=691883 RepID=A0A058ZC60_FONAL|nr:hypothetical protein H696_01373 [Fonticula alba]KCV71964.1 hypothetical protein H696_01373 [Fonticula alba]|eukprot:XP_009493542.1 hypothetical protein H696_01373 [Fonticula alba]